MLLPPDVLLVFRSKTSYQVIRVHDDVDERVDDTEEGRMAIWERETVILQNRSTAIRLATSRAPFKSIEEKIN